MLQIGNIDPLKMASDSLEDQEGPTHAHSIGHIRLMWWPNKFKVGHIDLILVIHHIHLKNLKMWIFQWVTYTNF